MNLNWITSPVAIYAVAAAGWLASLYLVFTVKLEIALERKRAAAEREQCRALTDRLIARVDELAAELRERPSQQPAFSPEGLNLQKRSEALRMYRRGSDPHAVEAALGLSPAEVTLLHKVHRVLSGEEEAAGSAPAQTAT